MCLLNHLNPAVERIGCACRSLCSCARESAAVASALSNILTAIHHIGSTAFPGIRAKPIIDILAVTKDIDLLDERVLRLLELDYEALGEFGIPGRRYFRKSNRVGNALTRFMPSRPVRQRSAVTSRFVIF